MRRVSVWCIVAICVAGWSLPAADAQVVYRDVSELTVQAEQIVIGDVIEITSYWDDNNVIKSLIVVEVSDYLLGEGDGIEVLEMSGGTVHDVSLHVSVLPEFELGDHVLLFLNDNEIRLVESFQGAYLTDGKNVARTAPSCGRVISQSTQLLTAFLEEIQEALPDGVVLNQPTVYQGDFQIPSPGARFGLCGYDWTYKSNPMGESIRINANCSDGDAGDAASQRAQIQLGMDAWNDSGADFAFTYGGTSSQTSVSYNGTNLIYFDTTPPDGGSYVAANYHWVSGGNMTESDIIYNDRDYSWWNGDGFCSGDMDIRNIATHELGHTLCLADLYSGGDSAKTMYGYVATCETKKRTLHSDDIDGIVDIYGGGSTDSTPPEPDPLTWAYPPAPASTSAIVMTATTATDAESPPVSYRFVVVTAGGDGGTNSDWQASTTYVDSGLDANTEYSYHCRARDNAPLLNTTDWSTTEETATEIETPTGVSFGLVYSNAIQIYADGTISNIAAGSSGLYFDSTTSGGDGGINAWVQTTQDQALGLSPDTLYTFRVKARNRNALETGYSPSGSKATLANVPAAPVLSNATTSTLDLNVDPNSNPSHTVFAVQCTATNPSDAAWDGMYVNASGQPSASAVWQTDSQWGTTTVTGLQSSTEYTFAVKARNQESVETGFGPSASLTTTSSGYDLGDMNCDGAVNGFDIDLFIMVLGGDLTGYYALEPDCDHMLADITEDGNVNGFDIDPFIALVGG